MTAGAGLPPLERAVVLAGGRGARLGRDKALAPFLGRSLLCRTIDALAGSFARIIVAAGTEARAEELARHVEGGAPRLPEALEFIADRRPGLGPLEGLASAMVRAGGGLLLATAVDRVWCPRPLLQLLWEEAARAGARGAVPRWRRGLEPAFAFYDAALLGDVDRALAGGERRLQALADLPGVRVLDLETPERRARLGVDRDVHGLEAMFMNLNTPAAIEEWEGRWRERGGPALSGAS